MNHLGKLTEIFAKHEVFVGGGAITSLFNGKQINDIDVYFRSKEQLASFIYDTFRDNQWVVCHTKKATLVKCKDVEVQMIHFRYFETAEEIFDTFDFTACMGVYDFKEEKFILHDDFLKHNSQRILKFNKNTSYPLISLLRVQKYKERGYTISKPEMLRIAMTCMMLEINSYDELKEQLGGMYGVSFDKLFKDVENEEFDISTAIDKIANIVYDEDYFKMPEPVYFETPDDIIDSIMDIEINYFKINQNVFRIRHDGTLKPVRNYLENPFLGDDYDGPVPRNWKNIDPKEYFDNTKFYKFVKQKGDKLVSYYEESFEYKVGEEAYAGDKTSYTTPVLYFNEWNRIDESTYVDSIDKILIEVSIKAEDFRNSRGHITATKCKVLRIVPEDEYKSQL